MDPYDYMLFFRRNEVTEQEALCDVEPDRLERALSRRLKELGCEPTDTRIVRVETPVTAYFPWFLEESRLLDALAPLGLRPEDLAGFLAEAWAAATSAYRARASERAGRLYVLHAFDGPLPVRTGSIEGELTCLHPALTSEARDVFPVIGEAGLVIAGRSLLLEFGAEIGGGNDGWQKVTADDPDRHRVPGDFPADGWFVVE